jgi:predicted DsbA family dithiol-disulfide isomerase
VGLEERFFEELLESKSQDASEVYAAARRAGLDPQALQQAATSAAPPQRLVKDRQLFTQAGLKGLPTLDIGRRRLMGEQSEAELRSAVQAALAPRR